MCGKDIDEDVDNVQITGSPPRVRERHSTTLSSPTSTGITPACAGKTCSYSKNSLYIEDHPRVCGKDTNSDEEFTQLPGSPPRVRERLIQRYKSHMIIRITPACAGKTHQVNVTQATARGSPPRVRERLRFGVLMSSFLGITPACAGKTLRTQLTREL